MITQKLKIIITQKLKFIITQKLKFIITQKLKFINTQKLKFIITQKLKFIIIQKLKFLRTQYSFPLNDMIDASVVADTCFVESGINICQHIGRKKVQKPAKGFATDGADDTAG